MKGTPRQPPPRPRQWEMRQSLKRGAVLIG